MDLQVTKEELNKLIAERDKTGESRVWCKAVTLLLLGTVLAAVFADPLVDAVNNFSSATSIPSFFISFIAMPLATNSSEAVSTIIFASRKEQKTTSVAFAEVCFSHIYNFNLSWVSEDFVAMFPRTTHKV